MSQVYVLNFEVTADTKRKLMEMLHGKTFEEFVDEMHELWVKTFFKKTVDTHKIAQ